MSSIRFPEMEKNESLKYPIYVESHTQSTDEAVTTTEWDTIAHVKFILNALVENGFFSLDNIVRPFYGMARTVFSIHSFNNNIKCDVNDAALCDKWIVCICRPLHHILLIIKSQHGNEMHVHRNFINAEVALVKW